MSGIPRWGCAIDIAIRWIKDSSDDELSLRRSSRECESRPQIPDCLDRVCEFVAG